MFGPFGNPQVAFGFGQLFGRTSEQVRVRRAASASREQHGGRARREDSDTDDLVDEFERAVLGENERLRREALPEGVTLEVEFHPTHLPVREESECGADLGIRLHIEGPQFKLTKGVLFQNKRMYGIGDAARFDGLRGDGEAQAEKMLRLTPASFFLLFNGLDVMTAIDWISPPAAWYPWYREFGPRPFPEVPRRFRPSHPDSLWNTGIMVLPASRVFAESRVARKAGQALSVEARHWIQASLPLGVFMADLFGSCFVGDVRASIVRLVTPPNLRDLESPGVKDFDPAMLPVRRLMSVTARGDVGGIVGGPA